MSDGEVPRSHVRVQSEVAVRLPHRACTKVRHRLRFLTDRVIVRILEIPLSNTYAHSGRRLRRTVSRDISTTYIEKCYVLIHFVPVVAGVGHRVVGHIDGAVGRDAGYQVSREG